MPTKNKAQKMSKWLDMPTERADKTTLLKIEIAYCTWFGIGMAVIKSSSRKREIVSHRAAMAYIAWFYTIASLQCIAEWQGRKEHTSTIHARNKVMEAIESGLPAANGFTSAKYAKEFINTFFKPSQVSL